MARDRTYLYLIRDLLVATGAFDEVRTSGRPEDAGVGSYDVKLASLELDGFVETDEYDDDDATPSIRRVNFTLWIMARVGTDPDLRDDECDRLQQVASNAINGQSFGATAYYGYTRIKGGKYERATGPERRLACAGQFAYEIPDFDAHDADA